MATQESKRTFHQGRMERDLDNRLIENGTYRDALNVNVGRSEGSSVGSVENLLGNERIHNNLSMTFTGDGTQFFTLPEGTVGIFTVELDGILLTSADWSFDEATRIVTISVAPSVGTDIIIGYDTQPNGLTIGTVVDPNNDRFYWFTAFQDINALYEYDLATQRTTTILTDRESRTQALPTCAPTVTADLTDTNDALGLRPDFPDFPTFPVGGCLDETASNYTPESAYHDQSVCRYEIVGCLDPNALNFNEAATTDDRSLCQYPLNNFTFEDGGFTCTVNQAGQGTVTFDDTTFPDLMFTYTAEGESGDQDNLITQLGISNQDRAVRFQFSVIVPAVDASGDAYDNAGQTLTGGDAECFSLQDGTDPPPPGEFNVSIITGTAPANTSVTGNGVAVGQMETAVSTDFSFLVHELSGFGFTARPSLAFTAQTGDGSVTVQTAPAARASYLVSVTEVTIGTENTILVPTWTANLAALFTAENLTVTCSITLAGAVSVVDAGGVSLSYELDRLDMDGNVVETITGSPATVPANNGVNAIRWRARYVATIPAGHPNSPGAVGVTDGLYASTISDQCDTDQLGSQLPMFRTLVTTNTSGAANVAGAGTYDSGNVNSGTTLTTATTFSVSATGGFAFTSTPTPRILNTTSGQAADDISRVTFNTTTGVLSSVTIGDEDETYEVRWENLEVETNVVTVTIVVQNPTGGTISYPGPATFSGTPGTSIATSIELAEIANEGFVRVALLGGSSIVANGVALPRRGFGDLPAGTILVNDAVDIFDQRIGEVIIPAEDTTVTLTTPTEFGVRPQAFVWTVSSTGVNFGQLADGTVIAATSFVRYTPPQDPSFFGAGGFGDASSLIAVNRNAVTYSVCSNTRPTLQDPSGGFSNNNARATASYTVTRTGTTCFSDSLNGGSIQRTSGGEDLPDTII